MIFYAIVIIVFFFIVNFALKSKNVKRRYIYILLNTFIGFVAGAIIGSGIGIASGGGGINGSLPCAIIFAVISFLVTCNFTKK